MFCEKKVSKLLITRQGRRGNVSYNEHSRTSCLYPRTGGVYSRFQQCYTARAQYGVSIASCRSPAGAARQPFGVSSSSSSISWPQASLAVDNNNVVGVLNQTGVVCTAAPISHEAAIRLNSQQNGFAVALSRLLLVS